MVQFARSICGSESCDMMQRMHVSVTVSVVCMQFCKHFKSSFDCSSSGLDFDTLCVLAFLFLIGYWPWAISLWHALRFMFRLRSFWIFSTAHLGFCSPFLHKTCSMNAEAWAFS